MRVVAHTRGRVESRRTRSVCYININLIFNFHIRVQHCQLLCVNTGTRVLNARALIAFIYLFCILYINF